MFPKTNTPKEYPNSNTSWHDRSLSAIAVGAKATFQATPVAGNKTWDAGRCDLPGPTAWQRWFVDDRQRDNGKTRWLVKDSYELDISCMYILYIVYNIWFYGCRMNRMWLKSLVGHDVHLYIRCMLNDWRLNWYVYPDLVGLIMSCYVARWNLDLQKRKIGIVNDRDGSNSTNVERLRKAFHQMFYGFEASFLSRVFNSNSPISSESYQKMVETCLKSSVLSWTNEPPCHMRPLCSSLHGIYVSFTLCNSRGIGKLIQVPAKIVRSSTPNSSSNLAKSKQKTLGDVGANVGWVLQQESLFKLCSKTKELKNQPTCPSRIRSTSK